MTQVSKIYVNKKISDKIFFLFLSSIVLCSSNEEAEAFIKDLFTPTEKIMLSKRFSIAYMLIKGYDYDSIKDVLKVSSATISNVSLWLKKEGNGIRKIIDKIKTKESTKNILVEIQNTIEEMFASAPGKNWSQSKKEAWVKRQKRKEAY